MGNQRLGLSYRPADTGSNAALRICAFRALGTRGTRIVQNPRDVRRRVKLEGLLCNINTINTPALQCISFDAMIKSCTFLR